MSKVEILKSFNEATSHVVAEWTRQGKRTHRDDLDKSVRCAECGFTAKPKEREGDKSIIWISMTDLRVLCQQHSYEERVMLRNRAKEALLAENPKLTNSEAWRQTPNIVGVTGVTMFSVIMTASEKTPRRRDLTESEKKIKSLLMEKVLCGFTAIGKNAEPKMIARNQGCVMNPKAILAIMGGPQKTKEQKKIALAIHENITSKEIFEGELPIFVETNTLKSVFVPILGGINPPMIDDGNGGKYRPKLYTLGIDVVRDFVRDEEKRQEELRQEEKSEALVENILNGGEDHFKEQNFSAKIEDILEADREKKEARREKREENNRRNSSSWKRGGQNSHRHQ